MTIEWEVRVFENRQPVFEALFTGALEMGRQYKGEEAPYAFIKSYFQVEADEPWTSLGGSMSEANLAWYVPP